jgi:hypothetical protein
LVPWSISLRRSFQSLNPKTFNYQAYAGSNSDTGTINDRAETFGKKVTFSRIADTVSHTAFVKSGLLVKMTFASPAIAIVAMGTDRSLLAAIPKTLRLRSAEIAGGTSATRLYCGYYIKLLVRLGLLWLFRTPFVLPMSAVGIALAVPKTLCAAYGRIESFGSFGCCKQNSCHACCRFSSTKQ